jgi:hypothetical protein
VLFNTLMVLALLVTTQSLELRDLRRRTGRLASALRLRVASLAVLGLTFAATAVSIGLAWEPMAAVIR